MNWRPHTTIGKVPQRALKHCINILIHQLIFILFMFLLDYDELYSFFYIIIIHLSVPDVYKADAVYNFKKHKVS